MGPYHASELSPSLMWPMPVHNLAPSCFVRRSIRLLLSRPPNIRISPSLHLPRFLVSDAPLKIYIESIGSSFEFQVPEFTIVPFPVTSLQTFRYSKSDSGSVFTGEIDIDFGSNPVMVRTEDQGLLVYNGTVYLPLHLPDHCSPNEVYKYSRFEWTFAGFDKRIPLTAFSFISQTDALAAPSLAIE